MWNDHKSIVLSKLSVILFIIILIAVAVTAPVCLVSWFISFSRASLAGTAPYFFATIYAGSIPAAILLWSLYRLLCHIERSEVFIPKNVEYLRRISWCSIIGGIVCFFSGFYYFPWILVAIAAAFMGLIIRIIKNVVARAVDLQDEVDHTI